MRKPFSFAAAGALALLAGPPLAAETEHAEKAQAELDKALEGRVAGKPVNCINPRDIRSSRNIGERTILYTMNSRLLYRNDPPGGCDGPGLGRALVTQVPSTRICRGDVARVVDPAAGFEYGSCTYGAFTPYRRAN